ncbi:unnamed protein product [Trifolium pratense]|uniref:Uncharacterized protein n=1 Tax=Trifolium pratense TaxID=57577 RepID=A0ACB0LRS5_TRIPR|nr:unnamed protein product [Trifolium pratense]
MASLIFTKTNHFRYASRSLISHYFRNPTPTSSLLSPSLSPHLSPHPRQVENQGYGNGSFMLYQRFLSSTSNQDKPPLSNNNNSVKDDPGQGKESGGEKEQKSDAGKSIRGSPVSWLSLVFLVLTGAGLVYYYDKQKKLHIEEIHSASEAVKQGAVKQGPSAGKAAIGGPFELTNHHGKRVTEKDFMGRWTLMYFGFTHCPDICPEELQKLVDAVDKIKEKSGIQTVPVFISVDPERDTVEQVAEYVKEFHPKLIGLTGSVEEIKSVARAYRVYYMKTAEEDSDYLVDHSIVIYLMAPDMGFVKFFGKNNDVDSLTDGVIKEIKQYYKK